MSCFKLAEDIQVKTSDIFLPGPLSAMSAQGREEYWATLSLRHCQGIGVRTIVKLLKGFGSACKACQHIGQWPDFGVSQTRASEYAKELWRVSAKKEWQRALICKADILLWLSPLYPECLRELADAPALLYTEGDLNLLKGPCLGVVGTRNPSRHGRAVAESLARGLANAGITVVSGMAMGIDRVAHQAALSGIGKSIGVLGTGIDINYPRSNEDIFAEMRQNGLIISEFAPGQAPNAAHFPVRNRLISGLSLGIVVVEAAVRSGSLVTARLALEQNREVFAVPGEAFSNQSLGCQNLVRQGARPVFCTEDILLDMLDSLKTFGIAPAIAQQIRKPGQANGQYKAVVKRLGPPSLLPGLEFESKLYRADAPAPATANCPTSNSGQEPIEVDTEAEKVSQLAVTSLLEGDVSAIILECLLNGPMNMDQLAEQTHIAVAELTSALLGLEITGQVLRLPGGRYEAS